MGVYKRKDRPSRNSTWYASYVDHRGKQIRFNTGTTDKQSAEAVLANRRTEDSKWREGIIDSRTDRLAAHERTPIQEHVDAYIASLVSDGRSKVHIERQRDRVTRIIRDAGFKRLSEIELTAVQQVLNAIRIRKDKSTLAAGTRKHWIQAIKGFTAWLAKAGGRLQFDPLTALKRPDSKRDRRLIRRALLVEEWQVIKSLLPASGARLGMPAEERLMAYELAIQTGLRASELHSLTRARLHLAGNKPMVVVPSDTTKDARDAYQSITVDLAGRLAAHVSGKAANTRVFALPRLDAMARMLRADVSFVHNRWMMGCDQDEAKRAMLATYPDFLLPINSNGERLDFHALRHTCGAWLALAGVHTKTIQSMMRHKDVTLTLDTYGHLFRSMEEQAVTRMELMIGGVTPELVVNLGASTVTAVEQPAT